MVHINFSFLKQTIREWNSIFAGQRWQQKRNVSALDNNCLWSTGHTSELSINWVEGGYETILEFEECCSVHLCDKRKQVTKLFKLKPQRSGFRTDFGLKEATMHYWRQELSDGKDGYLQKPIAFQH